MKFSDPIFVPVWLAMVGAFAPILQIISNFVLHWRVKDLQKEVNGQSAALLKVTGEAEFAKGEKAELARQSERDL